jgi:hypothetical protein
MPKKQPGKNNSIPDADPNADKVEAYVTWGDDLDSKKSALNESSASLNEYDGIHRTTGYARYSRDFSNLTDNTSGRPGLTRSDYDYFRPSESVPTQIKNIIRTADIVYQRVGLVKNVIDLMGDFASQGIRLVHRTKKVERFYRNWFQKVHGQERSERFLNNVYRVGNVVINRQTAKISKKTSDNLYKASGRADISLYEDDIIIEKREIPWKYTFIDPYYVDVIGDSLSSFVGKRIYEIQLPGQLRKTINSPKNDLERNIISQLPEDILQAAKNKTSYVLDADKTLVFHYKKDDWQIWAYPMIYAIMDDINIIEKLKLADLAALDGAISNIRIFKLGSLEHKIAPTKAAASKLSNILQNNVGGGTMDLIWGPDIELIESKTAVHQFLGEAKYTPHLNSIYAGLGIPPTLTGTYGASGTTNNFISLKTLTQRLEYGRRVLTEFWTREIEIVQKAMGFKYPAKIEFDRMDLSNEDTEKALLIQLADRNLISDELLQTIFGFDPDMEKNRINRENRERTSQRRVPKAGPWNDPEFENSLKKIVLQTGVATPSQVGLDLETKKKGEKTLYDLKMETAPKPLANPSSLVPTTKLVKDSPESLPGVPGQGRPKMSKDTEKRKTKTFKPRTGATLNIWAQEAQDKISTIINPLILEYFNKKNLRSLSSDESKYLENLKTQVLFSLEPFTTIDDSKITHHIKASENQAKKLISGYEYWLRCIGNDLNRPITIDEQKIIKSIYYSNIYNNT